MQLTFKNLQDWGKNKSLLQNRPEKQKQGQRCLQRSAQWIDQIVSTFWFYEIIKKIELKNIHLF
jgi:hypothetical protein